MTALFLLVVLGAGASRAQDKPEAPEMKEEIRVRAKASGPPLELPPPRAAKPLVDEVLGSLDVLNSPADSFAPEEKAEAQDWREPFPESPFLAFSPRAVAFPYNSWVFQVLEGRTLIWETSGKGKLKEPLEWDGYSSGGTLAVKVGASYQLKFQGESGGREFALASPPVSFKSLSLTDALGRARLEVESPALFKPGQAELSKESSLYLEALARRMRLSPRHSCSFYQKSPETPMALSRARALREQLAKKLLLNPRKVPLALLEPEGRGEVLSCLLSSGAY